MNYVTKNISRLGIILALIYIIIVGFFWISSKNCSDMFCEVPLAISTWPIGILADTHSLENLFNLPLNSLADTITFFSFVINTVALFIFGNWLKRPKGNSITS